MLIKKKVKRILLCTGIFIIILAFVNPIASRTQASQSLSLESGDKDIEAPTISDVKISDVDESGYTVSCTVNDNTGVSSVSFPSWNTDIHGGDNAVWLVGNVSENTASVRVNIKDLNSGAVSGSYITYIYVYDDAGNYTRAETPFVYVDPLALEKTIGAEIECSESEVKIILTGNNFPLAPLISKDFYIGYENNCSVKEMIVDSAIYDYCSVTMNNDMSANKVVFKYTSYETIDFSGNIAYVTFRDVESGDKFTVMNADGEIITVLYAENIVKETSGTAVSNLRITNINEMGYTVSCDIHNDVITSADFLSWNSDTHTSEDAVLLKGEISGTTAFARVNIADLKSGSMSGTYVTQILAYDTDGNEVAFEVLPVNIIVPTPIPTETPSPSPAVTPSPNPTEASTPNPTETPTPEPTITPEITDKPIKYTLGDVDSNGKIDSSDALLTLKYAAKIVDFNEYQNISADVTKDEKIDAEDALMILKYAARIIDSFE